MIKVTRMKGRTFDEVAMLIRENRRKQNISQMEMAKKLDLKNGQYISNIERNLCAFPIKWIPDVAAMLKIDEEEIIQAFVKDYETSLRMELNKIRILQ